MARRWMIFSRRRRRRRFGTALVVRVGGVVKSPGHETWKRCFFRTSGTKKEKIQWYVRALHFSSRVLHLHTLHSCISGNFMAGSWSQTSSAFQVRKICGDSAETKKKTYELCILYISCGRFYWGFATRIPTAETHTILQSFLEAEVEQEVDSEAQIWNSGTLGDTWAMVF